MRISQRQMYSNFIGNMNMTLSDLMESSMQGATQKRINRPSDDPAGMARVLLYRSSLNSIDSYKKNVENASAWLGLMDSTLLQIQNALSEAAVLAEQGATGTYTSENREQISFALREILSTLIGLSNTKFESQHIFAGHKTDAPAFVEGLYATCNDPALAAMSGQYIVQGGSSSTVLIQFTDSGPLAAGMTYRYSADGGKSWTDGTVALASSPPNPAGYVQVDAGGVALAMPPGANVTAIVDPDNPNETDNGTWIYIRPTAIYQGDDHDTQVATKYGGAGIIPGSLSAEGYFLRDVAVRIDDATGPPMKYSYSLDDGSTWTQATAPAGTPPYKLPIPGGFVNVDGVLADGDQIIVHPRRAEIRLDISATETMAVNAVGKDILGGLYQDPFTDFPQPVNGGGATNIFEVLGRLIGYAETGSQAGMQRGLEELKECVKVVLTKAAEVGGKENRLGAVAENLIMREFSETDNMSKIEDVDVTVLMTKLAQQQLAYNAVLKSSSMIMQMSLVNFI